MEMRPLAANDPLGLKIYCENFHVFSYSDRQYGKSSKYENKVTAEKIKKRSQRLRDLSNRKRNFYLQKFIGNVQEVLFEQKKDDLWTGLTDNYIRVKVKSDLDLNNQFLPVKFESIENNSILGTLA